MNRSIKLVLKRAVIDILIILGAFTVQTCVFPLLPMFSSVPNLLLILTFSFGFIPIIRFLRILFSDFLL